MKLNGLSNQQVKHFHDEGYLIVPSLFEREELAPLRRELDEQVGRTAARLVDEGKMSDPHASDGFDTRLARIFADSRENGEAIIRDIEGVPGGGFTGRAMFDLIRHPSLLAAIGSLVGPEI